MMDEPSMTELCEELLERAPEELEEDIKMWVVHTVRDVVDTNIKISACKTEHQKDYVRTVVFLICFVLLFLGCFVGVWFPNPSMHEVLKVGLFSTFALIINKLSGANMGNALGKKPTLPIASFLLTNNARTSKKTKQTTL